MEVQQNYKKYLKMRGVKEQKRLEIFHFESTNPLITLSFFYLVNNYSKTYFFRTFFSVIISLSFTLFGLLSFDWLQSVDCYCWILSWQKKTEPNHINFLIVFRRGEATKNITEIEIIHLLAACSQILTKVVVGCCEERYTIVLTIII